MTKKDLLKITETPLDCPCKGTGFFMGEGCATHKMTRGSEDVAEVLRDSYRSLRDIFARTHPSSDPSDFQDFIEARYAPTNPIEWVLGAQKIVRESLFFKYELDSEAPTRNDAQMSFDFSDKKEAN
jgi:hypothetical protein